MKPSVAFPLISYIHQEKLVSHDKQRKKIRERERKREYERERESKRESVRECV